MPNYVKEYLVRLGFEADQPAFRRLDQIMTEAENTVNRHTSGMIKDLLKIQIAIVGGFTAVSGAIVTLADKVAMADQGYRLMGLRMMMTTESARKLDIISKALGTTLEQASWDPETHQNWMVMAKDIDEMSESLGFFSGGKGEDALKGIRQFHTMFARFGVAVKFLGMGFVSSLFQKLFPDGGVAALGKITEWLVKFKEGLPGLADALADKAVPILRMTWLIFKDIGEVIKTGALAWTNLVGLVSDDSSIQGSTFSWEKFADALAKVTRFLKRIEDIFIDLEQAIASTATALTLFLHGDLEGAAQHMSVAGAAMAGGAQKRTAAAMVDMARNDVASADTPEAKEKAQKRLTAALAAQQEEETSTHWGATALAALPFVGTLGAGAGLKAGGKMVGRWIGSGIAGAAGGGGAAARGGAAAAGRAAALGSEWMLPAAEGAGGLGLGGTLLAGGALAGLGAVAMDYGHSASWLSHYSGLDWLNPGGMSDYNRRLYGGGAPGAGAGGGAPVAGVPGGVAEALKAASEATGVPLSLLTAQAYRESRFNAGAVGTKGEQGLMQIMPSTGMEIGLQHPFDAGENAQAGAGYLARLHTKYGNWREALIAYNQGAGSYAKHGAYPSAAAYADKILKDANQREAASGHDVTNNISMGGIYITKPGAEPHEIQMAVANGVRDGLRGQTQFDMAQVSPAWG